MTLFAIPLSPGEPSYSEQITLDGALYTLRLRWNTRMAAWFVEVYTADGALLVAPRRVVVGASLWRQFGYVEESPAGVLFAFDTTNRDIDPTLEDFGDRVRLIYSEGS